MIPTGNKDHADAVVVSTDPEDLGAIHRPDCAAVIWKRSPLASFNAWIGGLRPEQLPSASLVLRPESARDALSSICQGVDCPGCAERGRLIDDASALTAVFAAVMRTPFVRLRLKVVSSNAPGEFKVDEFAARLICTYRGMGTQYGVSHVDAPPRRMLTVPTGAPILLRGTRWPERPASGLRHRPPPIDETRETRLVLILDPLERSEPERRPAILH